MGKRILSTLGIWIVVYPILVTFFVWFISFFSTFEESSWQETFFATLILWIASSVLIAVFSGGRLSEYGLKKPVTYKWELWISLSVVIALITNSYLYFLYPGQLQLYDKLSFIETILLIWLFAPLTLALFYQGFIQSYLEKEGNATVAIVVTSLLFSLSHFWLYVAGRVEQIGPLITLLISTFFVGLLASYYRYQSQSVIASMVVLLVYNVLSSLFDMIF